MAPGGPDRRTPSLQVTRGRADRPVLAGTRLAIERDMIDEPLLELLLTRATDHALMLLDERGAVTAWLMGARTMFGYETEEMIGHRIERLFTSEDRKAGFPESELEVATLFGTAEDDRWMLRKDGSRLWASGVVTCLRDGDGRVVGFSKLLRDRTDVRGQIDALRNRAEALAEEDRRKAMMLATLAHELRSPLGALTNAAEMIELAYPHDPKLTYATQVMGRQSKFLSTLVEDLLEVARVRASKAPLQKRRISLQEVVAEALETAGPAIEKKEQRVEVLLAQAPIPLDADPTRLRQVFVNLLSNASKFSPPGSTIWIKGVTEGPEAVVRIVDRGRGISADLLPHVFDLFAQATDAVRDGAAGLGLGLPIVKDYVELHGGTVQVRSEGTGRGAEFVVRLPLPRGEPS